jgi:hypothetical protein
MGSEPEKFISQEIEVLRHEKTGNPVSFKWDSREYTISDIIAVWPDWGFSAGSPKRKSWRMRRHRTCYRVETTDGNVFELYHDRGLKPGGGNWILQSRLK